MRVIFYIGLGGRVFGVCTGLHVRTSREAYWSALNWQGCESVFISNVEESRSVDGLQDGLKIRKLPGTDLVVSELCLGTMMMRTDQS